MHHWSGIAVPYQWRTARLAARLGGCCINFTFASYDRTNGCNKSIQFERLGRIAIHPRIVAFVLVPRHGVGCEADNREVRRRFGQLFQLPYLLRRLKAIHLRHLLSSTGPRHSHKGNQGK